MKQILFIILFFSLAQLTFGQSSLDCEDFQSGLGYYYTITGKVIKKEKLKQKKYLTTIEIDTIIEEKSIVIMLGYLSDNKINCFNSEKSELYIFENENSKKLNIGKSYIIYVDSIVDDMAYIPICSRTRSINQTIYSVDSFKIGALSSDGKVIRISLDYVIEMDSLVLKEALSKYRYDIDKYLPKEVVKLIRNVIHDKESIFWENNYNILEQLCLKEINNTLIDNLGTLTLFKIKPAYNNVYKQ